MTKKTYVPHMYLVVCYLGICMGDCCSIVNSSNENRQPPETKIKKLIRKIILLYQNVIVRVRIATPESVHLVIVKYTDWLLFKKK